MGSTGMRARAASFVLVVLALLVIVPTALANPVSATYKHHSVAPNNVIAQQGQGTLPFTGTNLAIFAAAAIVLLGLGAGLRRVGRKRS
jgi:hypothetical protein